MNSLLQTFKRCLIAPLSRQLAFSGYGTNNDQKEEEEVGFRVVRNLHRARFVIEKRYLYKKLSGFGRFLVLISYFLFLLLFLPVIVVAILLAAQSDSDSRFNIV